MGNREINISVVAEVAKALKELNNQMVFVGGAVVSFYSDEPAADDIRPTDDIDLTIKLVNYKNWTDLQDQLAKLGFYPDPFGHAICSFKYKDIPIDIMPAEDSPIGPSNQWYLLGMEDLRSVVVDSETIQILSAPCYLAAKFEAYNNRGKDYRTSHDFEDIIFVLDNRDSILDEIGNAHPTIKEFLQQQIQKVLINSAWEEIISAHLNPFTIDERQPILLEKMNRIIKIK